MSKHVYRFGAGATEGDGSMKNLLGGKAAGLAEMSRIGLPVPPGFSISTEVCIDYQQRDDQLSEGVKEEILQSLQWLEGAMESGFGDSENPLLVSVRSGARVSMPGMMDTILNLGLNRETLEGLGRKANNRKFALDCYRRLIQMYGDVVLGLKVSSETGQDHFAAILEKVKQEVGVDSDADLDESALESIVDQYEGVILSETGSPFPQDPHEQLWGAIGAVFGSWGNERAIQYRRIYRIPDEWGTGCNIQSMVYGNLGPTSGTGVCFTRDPGLGDNTFFGEYLINAQGEDVVAGIRTPHPIAKLHEEMPALYNELLEIRTTLENYYKDMQDIEFTIQDGKLYLLQTRVGKRTGAAAVRIAVDLVSEGLIDEKTALSRMEPDALNIFLRPSFESSALSSAAEAGLMVGKGLPAGPGCATGTAVFSAEEADKRKQAGERVILIRPETSPEDIQGMHASEGILTARGGMTSHAAVVGRQMGKVCVVGLSALDINEEERSVECGGKTIREGDPISLDGFSGEVYASAIATQPSEVLSALMGEGDESQERPLWDMYQRVMTWADNARRLQVRANADTPEQARLSIALGAQGIGLCRTEHMFFEGDRIVAMRRMILAEDEPSRRAALADLLPVQRDDFAGIFREMNGRPVTIRTLDPPLHEFLPHDAEGQKQVADRFGLDPSTVARTVEKLHEFNPMLGHRGCRLGLVYPEITEMQARAIIEAAVLVTKEGVEVNPEIMIPLVSTQAELKNQVAVVRETAAAVFEEQGMEISYMVGTMIELPRACVRANEIAEEAEFFSFGTNDLTQTTFGLSRDDAGRFLPRYIEEGVIPYDPFVTIDVGVRDLMEIAVEKGKSAREGIKLGICGEHGGDPESVTFCHHLGLAYVSCSPYRIPIARLAAAIAAIQDEVS